MQFFNTITDRDDKWREFMEFSLDHVNPDLGIYCEFGVGHGASAKFICEKLPDDSKLYGFDSFHGLPAAWDKWPAGHFSTNGVIPVNHPKFQPIVGLYEKSIPLFMFADPEELTFLHIDCDLYESTRTVLYRMKDRIVPGTIIVFDEILWNQNNFLHEGFAFIEYIQHTGRKFETLAATQSGQMTVKILDD